MRLTAAQQIPFEDVLEREIDVMIAASGYEARATHAAWRLDGTSPAKRIAFAFTNNEQILSRPENDRRFDRLGYKLTAADGGAPLPIDILIHDLCGGGARESVAVVVDYSSMPRMWYASLLDALRSAEPKLRLIDVYLVYTPADFAPPAPTEGIPLERMEPLPGFFGLESASQPNTLIAGLGTTSTSP